jgi:hypothetical protein
MSTHKVSTIGRKNNANSEHHQYNGMFAHNAKLLTLTESAYVNLDLETAQRVVLLYSNVGVDVSIDGIVPFGKIGTGQELVLINRGLDTIAFVAHVDSVATDPNKTAISASLIPGAMLRLMHFVDRWWVHS